MVHPPGRPQVRAAVERRLRLPLGALDNRKVPASFSTSLLLESL
jgi:hypothetical protein